ncbi:MAG: hypothetical protein KDD25_09670, partial [Bdellovibrionales bacterium]|nr:hypothetical protein [Bdellovibrionales bacterium]
MWKILFITFFTTLLSLTAIAQEKETEGDEDTYMNKYDFTYSHGAFLPFGIVGVRDKYAIDTISFSHPFWIDHLEWTFGYFNSKDVILAQGTIAFRF